MDKSAAARRLLIMLENSDDSWDLIQKQKRMLYHNHFKETPPNPERVLTHTTGSKVDNAINDSNFRVKESEEDNQNISYTENFDQKQKTRECKYCGETFSKSPKLLNAHFHHLKDVRCKTCKRKFFCRTQLIEHLEKCGSSTQDVNVDQPPVQIPEQPPLLSPKPKRKRFKRHCRHCKVKLRSTRHKQRHRFVTKCKPCQRAFQCEQQLLEHLRLDHQEQEVVLRAESKRNQSGESEGVETRESDAVCSGESEGGQSGESRRQEDASSEEQEDFYNCYLCKNIFDSVGKVRRHMKNQLTCSVCKKTFLCSGLMKEHKLHDHARCLPCRMWFKDAEELKTHLDDQCYVCGNMFKCGTILKRHMKRYHPEAVPEEMLLTMEEFIPAKRLKMELVDEHSDSSEDTQVSEVLIQMVVKEEPSAEVVAEGVADKMKGGNIDSLLESLHMQMGKLDEGDSMIQPVASSSKVVVTFKQTLINLLAMNLTDDDLKRHTVAVLLSDFLGK